MTRRRSRPTFHSWLGAFHDVPDARGRLARQWAAERAKGIDHPDDPKPCYLRSERSIRRHLRKTADPRDLAALDALAVSYWLRIDRAYPATKDTP